MKITKTQLKQIIKEELETVIGEGIWPPKALKNYQLRRQNIPRQEQSQKAARLAGMKAIFDPETGAKTGEIELPPEERGPRQWPEWSRHHPEAPTGGLVKWNVNQRHENFMRDPGRHTFSYILDDASDSARQEGRLNGRSKEVVEHFRWMASGHWGSSDKNQAREWMKDAIYRWNRDNSYTGDERST